MSGHKLHLRLVTHNTESECATFLENDRTLKSPSPVTSPPASGHCFIVTITSFTSPTSPPLLKYVNHQVFHLVHVF
jgi:hypothetical protein